MVFKINIDMCLKKKLEFFFNRFKKGYQVLCVPKVLLTTAPQPLGRHVVNFTATLFFVLFFFIPESH